MARPGIAITVTMADCELWLADWIAHHLHVADQLFIWIDDQTEESFAQGFAGSRVSILPGHKLEHTSRLTQTLMRQDANTNAAIQMAAMAGLGWLVHVDADELFVPTRDSCWDTEADQLVFPNHEAVAVWEAKAPFRDLTQFRANGRHRFLLYDNGKAALRLHAPPVSARAHGPHRFAGVGATPSDAAAILHYALPGFEHWWRKYARLGAFSDHWQERPDEPIPPSFHTRSRDVVVEAIRSNDRSVAEAFYRQHMASTEDGLLRASRDPAGLVRLV